MKKIRISDLKIKRVQILVVIFILIGITIYGLSRAASTTVVIEPEYGTMSGAVSPIIDTTASGAQAIRFGYSFLQPDSRGFAPYAYVPWGDISMASVYNSTGVKNYTAAFVQDSGNCTPAWDGNSTLGLTSSRSTTIKTDINSIRNVGGDVTVSFGGQSGTELAVGCTTAESLRNAYKSVIDTYGLTRIDLDIEGATLSNTTANTRRAQALVTLQQTYPNLKIFVTLPVGTGGITSAGNSLLSVLGANKVTLAGINIMTMDYGTDPTPMDQLAIQSANSTFNQLKFITGLDDATIWKSINITPMIGVNDTSPEVFTLTNASSLRSFADLHKVGALSFWSINRDKSCANNAATLSDTCSGVVQSPYQYSGILNMPPN